MPEERLGPSAQSTTASRRLACLLGGASGDALGYRVEFSRWRDIERTYGPSGIRLAQAHGALVVSDDTQMTLFTLEGMARTAGTDGIVDEVREAFLDWLGTQGRTGSSREPRGRLARHDVMRQPQAPGTTCLTALRQGGRGTIERPINDSKGCGGVMRTAPIGFLPDTVSDAEVFRLGAEVAALTHGHPDGYLSAGAMAVLIRGALRDEPWTDTVTKVMDLLGGWPESRATSVAIASAMQAAAAGPSSRARVKQLGEGWVGEEALAIGLYSAVTAGSFAECVELAANHDGDSDSTASIAGQLYGARHGLEVVPADAVARLDVIEPLRCVMGSCREPRTAQY
jgi:ADP-ribosylglycohydrolase